MGNLTPELFEAAGVSVPATVPADAPRSGNGQAQNLGCATHPSLDRIEAGQQAWARLKSHSTWDDWKTLGTAIAELRTKAMQSAGTNQPKGSRYNKEFGARLRARGFDDIGGSTRKRLLQCMDNIGAIKVWLSTLKPDKQLRLNHPTTVLSAWKRSLLPPEPKPEKPDTDAWTTFFKQFTLEDFLAHMPPGWREDLRRRRDTLDKSKSSSTPDSKVTAAVKAALSHMASAADSNPGAVTASNEHAALNDLRGALCVLGKLDCSLHDIEVRVVPKKQRTRRAA